MELKSQELNHIKNIIFDMGNVLVDIDISFSIRAFEQLGLTNFKPEEIHPHNAGIFLDLELGNIANEQFISAIKALAKDRIPTDMEIYYAWNMLILPFDFKRFELLDKLRKNYKIFLLSNTNLPHREFFTPKFNAENPHLRTFESYFDRCFYSDAMHLRKPDREIYRQTLSEAQIDASETLFIDDNAPNLVGAKEVGISTYHLVKPETIFDLFQ